ncbi:hypothetical protein IQ266_14925 [filamentous cyanobacterium LEGE 11480]|uniref:Uncharacterized protein n=1 Tax=Romeriopsis navalis LEGE 11480 TaxID=2777977 RepID=A0A928Z595_9CYAN|nr:hypothetical protein [Romeriopsis navalis]MBE9031025.1 hypothetical protein [Romeriopsis navalis LEGE 11480]
MSAEVQPKNQMKTVFWFGMGALLFANRKALFHVAPQTAIGAVLIGIACMFPMYLWCANKVKGMPIFPFFTLTYLWTFCLPLLSENPNVLQYSPAAHLYASFTVVAFLGSATLVWWEFVKGARDIQNEFLALKSRPAETFFFWMLGAALLFNMYFLGGWFTVPDSIFSLVRGIIIGLSTLGIFVLSYRCGGGYLSRFRSSLLLFFLAGIILTSAATLILKTALTLFLMSTIAYVIGGRKLPTIPLIVGLVCLLPLHYGKHPMRHIYWNGPTKRVQPWEYPAWFQEWAGHSGGALFHKPNRWDAPEEEKESFVERSSVIHMLMMAQDKIPRLYPYMNGETYVLIPGLMIPRFLNPNKLRSHEGTHLLNVHVKRQTYEQTFKTVIAWGLLPEAYANFGFMGALMLGGVLGSFYGFVTVQGVGAPTFSFRTLFGILVISFALASTEWTAGVYAATLQQSSMPLLGMRLLFMRRFQQKRAQRKIAESAGINTEALQVLAENPELVQFLLEELEKQERAQSPRTLPPNASA